MKKLEGLKFLQENFPNLTVDCIFVDKPEDIIDKKIFEDKQNQICRIRAGNKYGSELSLPQATCENEEELQQFIKENKQKNSDMEFVIHRVTPKYFEAPYVGTIAVHNNKNHPSMRIELQRVTKDLVDAIDTGKRPRDWETCLILEYEFLNKFPKIRKNKDVNLESVKAAIMNLYNVGIKIFEIYEKTGKDIETYTRFNAYSSGEILLDDHRSNESFISKSRFNNIVRKKEIEMER